MAQVKRNEYEAMILINNIQGMQIKIYDDCFTYDSFKDNTIEELRNLQDSLIPDYNAVVKKD